ncbi:MAG TPA: mucoidy inhibitor MuiA family protein, partial [Trebonia sp.]|nr:mucoidy inhibitor MuiA family protein [Trebonia sp.]
MTETTTAAAGLDAPITSVTVFTDGARITRTGGIRLAAGPGSVLIRNLPATADTSSVRVAARGDGLALLNVEVHRRVAAVPLREQTARLRAEVERWRDAVQGLDDEDAAELAGLGFLTHLSEAAATALARAVGSGRAGYDELSGMAGHLSASTAGTLATRREIAARKRAAEQELAAAEARLRAAEQGAAKAAKTVAFIEVTVDLEARAATEAEIDLSYHVSGASWRSLYDLTLDGDRLTVSYLAEVTQQTGEDWPETALVLSTARQGLSRTLPELSPWYIGRPQPQPQPTAFTAVSSAMAAGGAEADDGPESEPRVRGAYPGAPKMHPRAARMLAARQAESESGAGLTYTVARPLAVPGDGGPHKTLVAAFEADAVLDYLTVPVLAPEA